MIGGKYTAVKIWVCAKSLWFHASYSWDWRIEFFDVSNLLQFKFHSRFADQEKKKKKKAL